MVQDERLPDRVSRLDALSPLQLDELAHLIGEVALDLWSVGESWPDIVERCLEAFEEDDRANGPVLLVPHKA